MDLDLDLLIDAAVLETSKKNKQNKTKQNKTKTEELAVVERTDKGEGGGRQEKEINRKKVEKSKEDYGRGKKGKQNYEVTKYTFPQSYLWIFFHTPSLIVNFFSIFRAIAVQCV